jgi:CDP-diacylglycerol--serine O-phosphatidyltransferase
LYFCIRQTQSKIALPLKGIRDNIPNAVTLLNLASGSVSVIFALSGEAVLASWMILLAAGLDFLDGFLARMLDARSLIGAQLDSLADVVSFGLAPAVIMYTLINSGQDSPAVLPGGISLLPLLGLLIVIASAYRLARFNNEPAQQERFSGLPTPATGIFVASLPLAFQQYEANDFVTGILTNPYILVMVTLVLAWLMVSRISMMSLKIKNFNWRENRSRFILALTALTLLALFGFAGMALSICGYILISFFDKDSLPAVKD